MRFCARELRSDGHQYGLDFEAGDWSEAEQICSENGWTLDGELHFVIPASEGFSHDQADELIAVLNEREQSSQH